MILIVCENSRISDTVALALGANTETPTGIHASTTVTVVTIPEKFIRQIPLDEMAEGEYPFIPEKFKMAVTMKELERELKPLFREAEEVVFASDGGADAQARFFNICRHFRVGCPRSRMWLNRLSYGAIRGAFHFRETGRHLHRLAQTGLVSKGMDMLFAYNIDQTCLHIGLPAYHLTRQEVIALEHVGDICHRFSDIDDDFNGFTVFLNTGDKDCFAADCSWADEAEAEKALAEVPVGKTLPATMTVDETADFNIRFHTLLTLQMDAYNNLGFMPGKTLKVAQKLYDKGLISSPMTDCPHLPAQLRGHLETVFSNVDGYCWEKSDATLNSHAIITLRAAEDGMTTAEVQLYRLIFNRMGAVVSQKPTRKYATIRVGIGNLCYTREWELTGLDYDTTPVGESDTVVEIADAGVFPDSATTSPVTNDFADVMCSLTSRAAFVDEMLHTGVPFTRQTDDYGSVLGSLIRKGLLTLDGDDIYLSPEGQYIYDELVGREISESLLTWQFEANDLYGGDQTGRAVMEGFAGTLLAMMELIDPDMEE